MSDQDFKYDEDDKKLLALYGKTHHVQLHESVDYKIKEAALRHIQFQQSRQSRHLRWALSSAAVLVLSVSVVLNFVPVDQSIAPKNIEPKMDELLSNDMAQSEESARVQVVEKKRVLAKRKAESSQKRIMKKSAPMMETQSLMISDAVDAESLSLISFMRVKLPFEMPVILQQFPQLSGLQKNKNRFDIYHKGKLLAEFERVDAKYYRITAYKGIIQLGIDIDWLMMSKAMSNSDINYMMMNGRLFAISWLVEG